MKRQKSTEKVVLVHICSLLLYLLYPSYKFKKIKTTQRFQRQRKGIPVISKIKLAVHQSSSNTVHSPLHLSAYKNTAHSKLTHKFTNTVTAPMASSSSSSLTNSLLISTFLFLTIFSSSHALFFTFVNNCPYTVWPAILPNEGHANLASGGFELRTFTHRSINVPDTHWAGRAWARTGCSTSNNKFTCLTGDCANRLECNGAGGSLPATLVQFDVHHGNNDFSSYSVSLVDGFNTPLTVTPHEGKGQCPVVGCKANLVATCPDVLQHRVPAVHGPVVACKSGCEAFHTDEFCCRNHFNNPQTCKPTVYTNFFKHACPETFTYAHDTPSLTHQCSSPRELKVIFCH